MPQGVGIKTKFFKMKNQEKSIKNIKENESIKKIVKNLIHGGGGGGLPVKPKPSSTMLVTIAELPELDHCAPR